MLHTSGCCCFSSSASSIYPLRKGIHALNAIIRAGDRHPIQFHAMRRVGSHLRAALVNAISHSSDSSAENRSVGIAITTVGLVIRVRRTFVRVFPLCKALRRILRTSLHVVRNDSNNDFAQRSRPTFASIHFPLIAISYLRPNGSIPNIIPTQPNPTHRAAGADKTSTMRPDKDDVAVLLAQVLCVHPLKDVDVQFVPPALRRCLSACSWCFASP